LAELSRVAVGRGSRASVALHRVLLAETVGTRPVFDEVNLQPGQLAPPGEGVLVIGDRVPRGGAGLPQTANWASCWSPPASTAWSAWRRWQRTKPQLADGASAGR
jgi:hypothetical protein